MNRTISVLPGNRPLTLREVVESRRRVIAGRVESEWVKDVEWEHALSSRPRKETDPIDVLLLPGEGRL